MPRPGVFLLLLALVFAPLVPPALALEPEGADAELYSVVRQLEQLRGLPLLRPIQSERLDVDAVRKLLMEDLDRELPEEEAAHYEVFLRTLKLIPPRYALREELIDLLTSQVAGFYNPKTRRMVLVEISPETMEAYPDIDPRQVERATLIHELDHALTDQHFQLGKLLADPEFDEGRDDQLLARRCLAEGDATLAMLLVMFKDQGMAIAPEAFPPIDSLLELLDLEAMTGAAMGDGLDGVPPYIRAELIEPYNLGLRMVMRAWRKGGWEAVNAMWDNPPQSTEQVLHPDRASDAPTAITLAPPAAGWQRLALFDLGELGTRIWLESALSKEFAAIAAAGWDGDLAALDSRPPTPEEKEYGAISRPALTLVSEWDTGGDANVFVDAVSTWFWKVGHQTGVEDWRISQQGRRVTITLTLAPEIEEVIVPLGKDPWSEVEFPLKGRKDQ